MNLRRTILWCSLACLGAAAHAQSPDLDELSLEALTQIEVSTPARRAQSANDVAAAVFVITQDDIRRVGARSIPEALRLAPGLQVAQIDASRWAISARGFNGRFANKLLVLMDGRTLYTPSFSGTYWDMQDTLIEDIARIEVIRGPAGTIWGTNAVNGIINIITKRSMQTDGATVGVVADDVGGRDIAARYGRAQDGRSWRVYAKASDQPANDRSGGGPSYDSSESARIGARTDVALDARNQMSLSSEAYSGKSGQTYTGTIFRALDWTSVGMKDREDLDGIWGLFALNHTAHQSQIDVHMYVDHSSRDSDLYRERRDTANLHAQQSLSRIGAHTLTWGGDADFTRNYLASSSLLTILDARDDTWLVSAYAQDEIAAFDDRLTTTIGVRVENGEYGGTAVLPNLRTHLRLSERASVWGAVARGERRPSRADTSVAMPTFTLAPGDPGNAFPLSVSILSLGNPQFKSEVLTAYELGWRWQPAEQWSIDTAFFYNDYDRLRGSTLQALYCQPQGIAYFEQPTCLFTAQSVTGTSRQDNSVAGEVYGAEILARWSPARHWRLTATYDYLHKNLFWATSAPTLDSFIFGQDPEHQLSLRSTVILGPRWDWDLLARSVGRLQPNGTAGYSEVDMRIAWRASADWEIALVGSNLLHARHAEAISELYDLVPTAIDRSLSLQLRWSPR